MEKDIGMEVIDGREALALIVIRETEDGSAMADIKSLRIDKLSAAKLLYGLAMQLKTLHESESPVSGGEGEQVLNRVARLYDESQVAAREFLSDPASPDSGSAQ